MAMDVQDERDREDVALYTLKEGSPREVRQTTQASEERARSLSPKGSEMKDKIHKRLEKLC